MLALLATAVIGSAPRWFDTMVAGYALTYDETRKPIGISDPKSGFFLLRTVECDGALLGLVLTQDRHVIANEGYAVPSIKAEGDMKLTVKPLPSLGTGKGVKIGDGTSQVQVKLGKPTRIERSGARKQFVDYVYIWPHGKSDTDGKDTQTYTFKANRLVEVNFLHDSGE